MLATYVRLDTPMMDVPGDSFLLSTNQILVRRTRLILLICLVGGFVFTMLQVAIWRPGSEPTLIVHLIGLVAATAGLIVLQNAWAVRHAWTMAIAAVSAAYVLTAIGRATTVSGEYVTTSILFVGAALVTGTIIPWGLWSQAFTVGIAATSLLAAVWYRDHSLAIAAPDAAVAVTVGFALSLVAAREITNYRLAHRRELIDRKRAERAVRRLAARLEQRVLERTVALERAHEELHRHQAELAHVLRLHTIGEMASALAHEINQPLCAITNYAQGGAQRLRSELVDPAGLLEVFEQIAQEGLRAGQILRGIRGLVRREEIEEAAIDVNVLASEAVRVLEPQARLHGVTVRLEGAADLPLVQANATQIEQVMVNLMLNGVQAISGSERPRREVVVFTAFNGDAVEVAVRDTGEGIAPTVASKLFTPFVTTKERGLGLGLAISRSIIENHGGRLWATPNADAGTTFSFSLPIIVMDDPTATRH